MASRGRSIHLSEQQVFSFAFSFSLLGNVTSAGSRCSTWQYKIGSLFRKRLATEARLAKTVSGAKVFVVNLGSHTLLSEK